MDKITLCGIECRAIIGTLPCERLRRQKIVIDADLSLDLAQAGASDRLDYTVDYSAVEREIVGIAETSRFQLLEALATAIGRKILHHTLIASCRVRIFKPAASQAGKGVAVEMNFARR